MKKKTKYTLTIAAIVLMAIGAAAWWLGFHEEPLPEGLIQANGRIEGDDYTVASKVAGKVVEILVHEGDAV